MSSPKGLLDDETLRNLKTSFYWQEMHEFAMTCYTTKHLNAFEGWVENLSLRFFCDLCKPHFQQYLKENPISQSPNPVEWAWKFHNAVNKRLNKREYTFKEAQSSLIDNRKCESCKLEK